MLCWKIISSHLIGNKMNKNLRKKFIWHCQKIYFFACNALLAMTFSEKSNQQKCICFDLCLHFEILAFFAFVCVYARDNPVGLNYDDAPFCFFLFWYRYVYNFLAIASFAISFFFFFAKFFFFPFAKIGNLAH